MKRTYVKPEFKSEEMLEQTSLACSLRLNLTIGCYVPPDHPFDFTCPSNVSKDGTWYGDICSGGGLAGSPECAEEQNLS